VLTGKFDQHAHREGMFSSNPPLVFDRCRSPGQGIEEQLVDETPAPVFAGLEGADDGVFRSAVVFAGVAILGIVAAADVATLHAEPQVDPGIAHGQALLAAAGVGAQVVLDGAQVLAGFWFRHGGSSW
jgi:hypothetical protein